MGRLARPRQVIAGDGSAKKKGPIRHDLVVISFQNLRREPLALVSGGRLGLGEVELVGVVGHRSPSGTGCRCHGPGPCLGGVVAFQNSFEQIA